RAVVHGTPLRLVAIGASTGGPLALQGMLARLRKCFGAPLVIVQHISTGFAEGLAQWLKRSAGFPVQVAADGDRLRCGAAYVAPDGVHTTVQADGRIVLSDAPPEYGFRPAVSCLFRSAAEQYGAAAAGVLLTGMGQDGAQELKLMREAGALTLVQDRASAVIHGMPGEALRLGGAVHALAPPEIADALNALVPPMEQ
ncbi:MAG TPA: CheB methylesterase domain-containing protein, partial [Albitalea sp.]